ncbi:MAG: hypothetical protein JKY18_05375 [Flavobacteriales bacterium]|nr:hypothetical protein [Flavobacteriales bacterium]
MKGEKTAIVVLTLVALIGLGTLHYFNNPLVFSPEVWQSAPEKRADMVNDIVSGNRLPGKSKSEIIELLGQPSSVADKITVNDQKGVVMKYKVGFDKIGQLNISLNLDLVNDTVVLVYKYHE